MDPEVRAVQELNAIFQRMEVPCEVLMSPEEGKHVRATRPLAAHEALFEEVPIASWSAPLFTHAVLANEGNEKKEALCFYCLRRKTESSASDVEQLDKKAEEEEPTEWTDCKACRAAFCSGSCRRNATALHRLLCEPAKTLLQRAAGDAATPGGSGTAAAQRLEQGITLDGLARCAAWLISRIGFTIQQAQLPASAFMFDEQKKEEGGGASSAAAVASLQEQIFTAASAPFNRLLAAPDSTIYKGINTKMWKQSIRDALQRTAPDFLNDCVSPPLESSDKDGETKRLCKWSEALLAAALSDDTLHTMLGQLALNAHAINTVIYLPKHEEEEKDIRNGKPEKKEVENGDTEHEITQTKRFDVVVKGAGLYGLLACFNHSCEPNLVVSHPHGTHELEVRAIRAIPTGEPLTISYIPLGAETTVVEKDSVLSETKKKEVREGLQERRRQLRQYFFECRCPRCQREAALTA
eukprot:gene9838-6911_t